MPRIPVFGLILLAAVPVRADLRVVPVKGDIVLTSGEVSCPSLPSGCTLCINDEDTTGDNRLIIAMGETYPFTTTTGFAEGVVRPFVEVDGARIPPDLLPCGAWFRYGIGWQDYFTPNPCDGTAPGVTYQIGSMPEVTVTGDGNDTFTIPATEASEVPFTISICSQFFYWGGGCNVSGSSDESWELYVPAAMNAVMVSAGDVPPMAMPGSDFTVDFSASSGGTVMVSHVNADPPVTETIDHLNGYWDIHSDLAPGAFSAQVSFGYDGAVLPPEVAPETIMVAVYDMSTDNWTTLTTSVDVSRQMATATVDRFGKFVLVGDSALRAQTERWGAIKALYAGDNE